MWAYVDKKGLVDFITDTKKGFGVGVLQKLVDIPDGVAVEVGWHYTVEDGFTPPTAEEIEAHQKSEEMLDKMDRILDILDKAVDILESNGVITPEDVITIWSAGK